MQKIHLQATKWLCLSVLILERRSLLRVRKFELGAVKLSVATGMGNREQIPSIVADLGSV